MTALHELAGMVNLALTADQFKTYLKTLKMGAWRPSMIVLHNTGLNPHWTKDTTPAQSLQLMKNSSVTWASPPNNWPSGPHMEIGPNGIIVLASPLTAPGTHSPSWNHVSWGIEMVGDFDKEPFTDLQRDTVVAVLKALYALLGKEANENTFKLHKEDPHTSHKHCPGANCGDKATWLARINDVAPAEAVLDLTPIGHLHPSPWVENDLKRLEAFRDVAYNLKGVWHVGYGFRDGFRGLHIDATTTMTREQADAYFDESVNLMAGTIQQAIHAPLTQSQIDGLILIAWNIGSNGLAGSTIAKRLNASPPDYVGAADAFLMWNKARPTPAEPPVFNQALDDRRHYERSVFLGLIGPNVPAVGKAPMAPKALPNPGTVGHGLNGEKIMDNSKPWWASQTIWGGIGSVIAGGVAAVAALKGGDISGASASAMAAYTALAGIVAAFGGLQSIIGRFKATSAIAKAPAVAK